jgi:hypothetical protein
MGAHGGAKYSKRRCAYAGLNTQQRARPCWKPFRHGGRSLAQLAGGSKVSVPQGPDDAIEREHVAQARKLRSRLIVEQRQRRVRVSQRGRRIGSQRGPTPKRKGAERSIVGRGVHPSEGAIGGIGSLVNESGLGGQQVVQ